MTEKAVVYFIERGLYKARLNHLMTLAEKSDFFELAKTYSGEVTHLVIQNCTKSQALEYLTKTKKIKSEILGERSKNQLFVDVQWFTSCLKEKKLLPVLECHIIKEKVEEDEPLLKKAKLEDRKIPMYACQRSTPLNHKNKVFTDALEILEEHARYRGDPNAEARALAFRRGSSTLKCLPFKISKVSELKNLPYIDVGGSSKPGHCKRVIMDILENGHSTEVEEVTSNEFHETMKIFCAIFGVGPQTARKWFYDLKLRTLEDVRNCSAVSLNRDQRFGLEYYEDLNSPLPVSDAKIFEKLVGDIATAIQPGIEVTLVGGFRRGKPAGHDIDLLITHPEEGKEKILHLIIDKLKDRFIHSDKKSGSTDNPFHSKPGQTTDHFEKVLGIFKMEKTDVSKDSTERDWIARRVDLIIVPYSQFPFALLGWSGSRHFEREIRRYAKSEKQMALTSHGMYTYDGQSIPASSEEEIFEKLGLEYQEPYNRNC